MFKWFAGKNRRVLSTVIIVILVLAMVVPICVSLISGL